MGRLFVFLASVASLLIADQAQADSIQWRVVNNFRAINGEQEQTRYLDEMHDYVCWSDHNQKRKGCNHKQIFSADQIGAPTLRDYPTVWKDAIYSYGASYVSEKRRKVIAAVPGDAIKCDWFVDGDKQPFGRCRDFIFETTLGSHTLKVNVLGKDRTNSTHEETIEIRDILIVAIGDSYGSGEGVPHLLYKKPQSNGIGPPLGETSPVWWDQRCHRSLFSPSAIAAAELASANPHGSVTLVSFTCSGADLRMEGMFATYLGRETVYQVTHWENHVPGFYAHGTVEPQILSVTRTLCGSQFRSTTNSCESPRSPDYVIVSIGGNDLGFGEIVRALVLACNSECLKGFKQDIDRELRVLHTNLGELKKSIDKWSPKNVLLTEYMDPTQSGDGKKRRYCEDKAFGDRVLTFSIAPMFGYAIDEKESQFAHEQVVVPLNKELESFAGGQPNWRLVGKLAEASQSHGYCSDRSWFNTYEDAQAIQGNIPIDGDTVPHAILGGIATGTMHPNIVGFYNVASHIKMEFQKDGILGKLPK